MKPRRTPRQPRESVILLKEKFGGKCAVCGYDKNYAALDFHHVLPTEKSRGVSVSSEKGVMEADKCLLLCRNCHADHHHPHYRKNVDDRGKATIVDNLEVIMDASIPGYKREAVRRSMTPEQYEVMLDHLDPVRVEKRRVAMYQNFI